MSYRLRKRLETCRHWIFDLDGTLTVAVHDFAFIRSDLAVPEGVDILAYLDGLTPDAAAPLRRRLDAIEADLLPVTRPSPGVFELLDVLSRRGASLGILTRNSRATARRTLQAIGLAALFPEDAVIGRDEARPKPDPEGILMLSSAWSVDPGCTAMVGDYLYDLQAGRAAGSLTVHVDPSSSFRWPDLADVAVPDLTSLSRIVTLS